MRGVRMSDLPPEEVLRIAREAVESLTDRAATAAHAAGQARRLEDEARSALEEARSDLAASREAVLLERAASAEARAEVERLKQRLGHDTRQGPLIVQCPPEFMDEMLRMNADFPGGIVVVPTSTSEVSDAVATLTQRRDYLTGRIAAKTEVGWETQWDERERAALTTILAVVAHT